MSESWSMSLQPYVLMELLSYSTNHLNLISIYKEICKEQNLECLTVLIVSTLPQNITELNKNTGPVFLD